jgi:hypothetical protein
MKLAEKNKAKQDAKDNAKKEKVLIKTQKKALKTPSKKASLSSTSF